LPVLDTVVLFGAADPKDPAHEKSLIYLSRLDQPGFYIATFALLEFDVVMKSRGYTYAERTVRHALFARDYPTSSTKVRPLSPEILYLIAKLEGEEKVDYFDAGVAAEAQAYDGQVVSTDGVFDRLQGLKRIW
jgi:predicted nucleic acid-binding protein